MSKVTVDPYQVLENLEKILDSDPHIDEVGFIHPAQFAAFDREVGSSSTSSDNFFWCREHKLGINTLNLFMLYNAAKASFLISYRSYRTSSIDPLIKEDEISSAEIDVMKHSRAVLLLSCDFGTAWNSRKMIVSKKHLPSMLMDELRFSALILSYSPKSERAWSHRKWVIKKLGKKYECIEEIVTKESEFVKTIAENFKMNYRAWSYRCWLVSHMSNSHLLHELQNSRDWAVRHIADNSCYHYRSCLLLKIVENMNNGSVCETFPYQLWKGELDWDALLIERYVGRESLWLHRRFLSLIWIRHLESNNIRAFVEDELMFFHRCSVILDNAFGDYQAQASHSATYIAWLAKQMPDSFFVELQKSSHYETIKLLLSNMGKSFLWDSIIASCSSTK